MKILLSNDDGINAPGIRALHEAIADGRKLLFEGANAALLDVDHGTYRWR